jgi:hypothetical protein
MTVVKSTGGCDDDDDDDDAPPRSSFKLDILALPPPPLPPLREGFAPLFQSIVDDSAAASCSLVWLADRDGLAVARRVPAALLVVVDMATTSSTYTRRDLLTIGTLSRDLYHTKSHKMTVRLDTLGVLYSSAIHYLNSCKSCVQ